MKTVIISPGWNQSSDDGRYDFIANAYRDKGYEVVRYSPQWDGRTMTDWVDGLIRIIDKTDGDAALWGFSLGAMASLIVSAQRPVISLLLCSPSGYFKEYLPLIDDRYLSQWSKRQLDAFDVLSLYGIVEKMQSKDNYVLAGDLEIEEWPSFRRIVDDLKALDKFNVRIIKETHHDFSMSNYRQAISEVIDNLA